MNTEENKSPEGVLGAIARRVAVVGVVTLAYLAPPPEARADAHGDLDVRPYVGVGLEYLTLDFDYTLPATFSGDPYADKYLAVDLHFGARLGDWFGAEIGVFQTAEEDQDLTVSGVAVRTETDIRGLYLDLLGYLPVSPDGPDLIGSIGISRVTADGFASALGESVEGKQTETVVRFGLGIQHHINENLAVKALYRRHDTDNFEGVDHADSFHLGVNYHFGSMN